MHIRPTALTAAALLLTACAATPEQIAAREAAQKRYEQDLQVSLAAQCDPQTAALMHQQFDQPQFTTEQAKQDFRLRYIEKINEPLFQSCYKMAWQNHISQQRLRQMERYYDWHDDFYPWRRPFGRWYW